MWSAERRWCDVYLLVEQFVFMCVHAYTTGPPSQSRRMCLALSMSCEEMMLGVCAPHNYMYMRLAYDEQPAGVAGRRAGSGSAANVLGGAALQESRNLAVPIVDDCTRVRVHCIACCVGCTTYSCSCVRAKIEYSMCARLCAVPFMARPHDGHADVSK